MTTYRIDWHWFNAEGNGYNTIDVNLPPAKIVAQVALHGHTGGGTTYAGIQQYRRRLSSGADMPVDFGEWPSWPPIIFDFISQITFALATGAEQHGWLVARMDYWN